MIEFLSKWVEGIAIAVIIASIFEMILPNGNIKKYVKVILGIYIVFSIISPFADNKVMGKFDISKKIDNYSHSLENKDFSKQNGDIANNDYLKDEGTIANNDYSKNEASSEKRLNKIYEDTFEKELVQTIEKEGFSVYKCEVKGNFNAEEGNAGINKIQITLESQKSIKKKSDKDDNAINPYGDNNLIQSNKEDNTIKSQKDDNKIKSDEENNLTKSDNDESRIKIENVTEVPKVEINVGKKITNNTEENVSAKDIDTLKKYLSKHYEIDKGVIEIHVR